MHTYKLWTRYGSISSLSKNYIARDREEMEEDVRAGILGRLYNEGKFKTALYCMKSSAM